GRGVWGRADDDEHRPRRIGHSVSPSVPATGGTAPLAANRRKFRRGSFMMHSPSKRAIASFHCTVTAAIDSSPGTVAQGPSLPICRVRSWVANGEQSGPAVHISKMTRLTQSGRPTDEVCELTHTTQP